MPAKAETSFVPPEYQDRPPFERFCVTLPPDLGDYARQQAQRYPGQRANSNISAFLRDLVEKHRAAYVVRKGRKCKR